MSGPWSKMVAPLIGRFEVAAAFGKEATCNPTGSRAMADLMKTMAERLDRAVELQLAAAPDPTLARSLSEDKANG